jgi:Uma2 family endonuclease
MTTILKLGPADHGRPMTLEEFDAGDYEQGYKYELIDGKLYVSPEPNMPEGLLEDWLGEKLRLYKAEHPEVINFISPKARIFVPGRPGTTVPEPDLAAYHDLPLTEDWDELDWRDFSPILVIEILTGDDPTKDLVRNVDLYFRVPAIKEYWVVDGREKVSRPSMRVHRRYGKRWKVIDLAFGETYATRLLPGFTLTIDPRG